MQKTMFTRELLSHANVLSESSFTKKVYCLGKWQEMAHHVQFVEVTIGYPKFISTNMLSWVLAFNDLMHHCTDDEGILDLLTKDFHHLDVICINQTQSLSPHGK